MALLATCPCSLCGKDTILRGPRLCTACYQAMMRLELLLVSPEAAIRRAREISKASLNRWVEYRDWLAAQPIPAELSHRLSDEFFKEPE